MTGKTELPLNLGKTASEYLEELRKNLELALLDRYPECFSDKPGCCNIIQHEIQVSKDSQPKRLRAYRVPENLKPKVEEQIQELLKLGIIKPSKSEMGIPIVCVLKCKDGVQIALYYRYLNKYCEDHDYLMLDINDMMQQRLQDCYVTMCVIQRANHRMAT